MSNSLIPDSDYKKLHAVVAAQIELGTARIKQAYRAEVVYTSWNVGRVICETIAFDEGTSDRNGAIIARLAHDFKKCRVFFYQVIKFYRVYPVLPKTNLTWSHYMLLMTVDDPTERRALEQRAKREGISAKEFEPVVRLREGRIPKRGRPPISPLKTQTLPVERGMLYHYRSLANDPGQVDQGRMLIDIGFGIERDVKGPDGEPIRPGMVVRAVREGEDYSVRFANSEPARLYTYQARIKRVTDGDTLHLRVDLGFRSWITQTFRLRGIDAAEVGSALGRKAKQFVQEIFEANPWVVIKTYKDDKYGRFLADVFYGSKDQEPQWIVKEGKFLNQVLLNEGLAVRM